MAKRRPTPKPSPLDGYAYSPAAFRDDLIVDVDGVARRFGECQDDWQRADFAALDPALARATGRGGGTAKMRAYLERPRGHSKTTDLAVTVAWALAFAGRPLKGYAFAADKDQASLLRDALETLIRLNPWLSSILSVQRSVVANVAGKLPGAGSRLEIFTSDVGSSYGILPDLIIADELCHWTGDGSLWQSLMSSAAKRSNCLLVVISNAGFVDSWQWKIREAARTDEAWIFSRLDGPRATWLSKARLEEQRRMLPAVAYARLWENAWSSGGGDALLPSDIEAAFVAGLRPMTGHEKDWDFVAGVDLGVTRDASAVVALGVKRDGPDTGRIRLAATRLWKPGLTRVDLIDVERAIRDFNQRFGFRIVNYDPWQAEHLAQRLRYERVEMQHINPTGGNLQAIASTLIESFTDRRLQLYHDANLRRDLHKLRVEERSYGFRLTSPRDEDGHGDTATAFGLALLAANELADNPRVEVGVWGEDDDWNSPSNSNALEARRMWARMIARRPF